MNPTPKGWPRVTAGLIYADPGKAIDWLCKAFGFVVRLRVDGDDGQVIHAELEYGDGLVTVGQGGRTGELHGRYQSPRELDGRTTVSLFVYVDDLEAHHQRAVAHGATIIDAPKLHDYGEAYWADRSYGCRDLEGHDWWFAQRVRG